MKVTQVGIRPTEASEKAGRPALTPELLAASGARYSRSNEGLGAILARIDPDNLDKSVDAIFRMIDYGHQSIADMAPVALFIDGVSLWLAYHLWTLCPTAGGQESSTRYIRLDVDALAPADRLGIAPERRPDWERQMAAAFGAYQSALAVWEGVAEAHPDEAARIPRALRDDPSPKAQRAVARMRRNFAFDRARYFLPAASLTNVMLIQSARAWVGVCQNLLSHPLPEAQALGALVRDELGLAAPRLLRHAVRHEGIAQGLNAEFTARRALAAKSPPTGEAAAAPFLDAVTPDGAGGNTLADDLAFHDNRYAYVGETLRRTTARFGWEAIAFAELRDLNRHRTGNKYCPFVPRGFYHAADELPADADANAYEVLGEAGREATQTAHARLSEGDPAYVYWTLLGTQFFFEHVTTADKFLYEAELRTGTGAHYRYARHLRDTLALWYDRFPQTRGLVLEGGAEPE